MANSVTTTVLEDGARNFIIKFEGVLDTSDVAATGTLGTAASGVTTLGSRVITFTAGGLAPLQGQYVTGTGIPAGAYITSVDSTTQVTLNVPATASGTGLTFTLVAGQIVIADPAMVSTIDPRTGALPSTFVLKAIPQYSIEDLLTVNLFWDATAPVRIEELAGREDSYYEYFGGLKNMAGTYNSLGIFTPATGFTGRVTATTQGWGAGTTLSFSLILHFTKVA